MKVACDIDGTITDFEKFTYRYSAQYMKKRYDWEILNHSGYDIDQMYMIVPRLMESGYSKHEAEVECEKIVGKFWNRYYLKYIFLRYVRKGVGKTFRKLRKSGWEIIIVSSRKGAADKTFRGRFLYKTVEMQLYLNRVCYDELYIVADDEEKIKKIMEEQPDAVIDDKLEMIQRIGKTIPTICMISSYNRKQTEAYCEAVGFEGDKVYEVLEGLRKHQKR
jgi:uncharacterized HAD superfamily protein